MWSFVGKKRNKVWIWLALLVVDNKRQIVGFHVGTRDKKGAEGLWDSLPPEVKKEGIFYTDFWDSYKEVIPSESHNAVGKGSGKTNHIERFNNTLRQRISRLGRKTLSFSKKLINHIGAVLNFVTYYNKESCV